MFNNTQLEKAFLELNTTYMDLLKNHTSFNTQFTQLQLGYETLLEESQDYLTLKEQYEELEQQYNTLQAQYNNLQSQYSILEEEYDRYVSAYQKLRDEINQRHMHSNVEAFITPLDSSVSSIVYDITGGWSNHLDWNEFWGDVKEMYQWVVDNIEYRFDGLYPALPYDPSGLVIYSTEMWQFANETLDLGKGDCEDQAILLCSMIKSYTDSAYKTECICITGSLSAHMGVQLPVAGDKLVILDPAGNYYSSDIWGNIVFNDVATEINNWLDYWKPQLGNDAYVHRVFSNSIDRTFSSTSDYITWMLNR